MGLLTRDIKTINDLFVHTLRDIYYAEQQIAKSIMPSSRSRNLLCRAADREIAAGHVEKAHDTQLKQALQAHLGETKNHVRRLEEVFRLHGVDAKGVDCPAIDGILEEAEDVAGDVADDQVLDAAIIAAAQAVEHYEITRYRSLIAWAKRLGRNDCATPLDQNLQEEKAADKKLTDIAESKVNLRAA